MTLRVKISGMKGAISEIEIKKELESKGLVVHEISYESQTAVISCGCPKEACKCGPIIRHAIRSVGCSIESVEAIE